MKKLPNDSVVLLGFFLLLLWMDMRLMHLVMAPGVLMRPDILVGVLRRPGGLVELLAAAAGQLLCCRVGGAVALTVIAALTLWLSGQLLKALNGGACPNGLRYTPLFIFTAATGTLFFALESVFSTVVLLVLASVWTAGKRWPVPARAILLAILSAMLYRSTASEPRIFGWLWTTVPLRLHVLVLLAGWALFCTGYELLRNRRTGWRSVMHPLWILAVITIASVASEWFRPPPPANLTPYYAVRPFWQTLLSLAMYASSGLTMLLLFALRRIAPRIPHRLKLVSHGSGALPAACTRRAAAGALLIATGFLSWWAPFEWTAPSQTLRRALRVHHLVGAGDYKEALHEAERAVSRMPLKHYTLALGYDINLSMHKRGRLLEDMFAFPQSPVAFLPPFRHHTVLFNSLMDNERVIDTALHLGRLHDAEHVAYEMMARTAGYHPGLFQRLALIHLVKNEPDAARLFLNNLASDWSQRKKALYYLQALIHDPDLNNIAAIQQLRARMLPKDDMEETLVKAGDADAIAWRWDRQLLNLLDHNPDNRMAADYLLATYLFHNNSHAVALRAHRLFAAGYNELPARVQEALVFHWAQSGYLPPAAEHIPRQLFIDYQRFAQLAERCRLTRDETAWKPLREFQGTYWFHALTAPSRQPETIRLPQGYH